MSRVCSVCQRGQISGNQVSHSHRKTRRSWGVNVQKVSSEYVCTRCLRSGKVNRA